MSIAWLFIVIDLAAAAFAAWLVPQLDFLGGGINGLQVLGGLGSALLVLCAAALAWPGWSGLWRTAFALDALALAGIVAASAWTALTAGATGNPMRIYWPHASVVAAVFAANLLSLWFFGQRSR